MGWFGGWFSSESSSSGENPLRKLDPKLREFLERESPVKVHATTLQERPAASAPAAASKQDTGSNAQQQQQQQQQPSANNGPAVPRESLFPDGRYAELWRTYRAPAAIDAELKSDHEKLMDVLNGYKERKAQIGRAALENCADEQLDWASCMKSGDWTARLTLCSAQVRRFERCYTMQSRLLKSLGYLSRSDRSTDIDEQIQMHADTLYHRMLDQESAIEAAKAEGKPIPVFPPLIAKSTAGPNDEDVKLGPEAQKKWKERLEKIAEEDRAAEEHAMKAEVKAKAEAASKIQSLWDEQAKERASRKAKGEATIGDRVSGLFGK